MYDYTGKTVLITGGSLGIGAALAHEYARRKARLVLVARNPGRLDDFAKTLEDAYGASVTTFACDLGAPGAATRVFDEMAARGVDVDVLVNNAGYGCHGGFAESPIETQLGQVDLNVRALVELTHRFLPGIEQRRGGIIMVASTAAFQPVPYMAVYGATKAFVLSFSEALWGEYRKRGVRVLALCPGATDTPFFTRAGEAAAVGKKATPEDVARAALRAFDANRSFVIEGALNRFTAFVTRFSPRQLTVMLTAKIMTSKASPALPRG